MTRGRAVGMIALLGLFVVACLVSIRAGSVSLGLGAVWDALLGRGDLSTVTVHVRRLREKIESDPAHPTLLHTIWGVGYRFDTVELAVAE